MNYYLSKGSVIIEHNSKNLSGVTNEAKKGIHAMNKPKTDYIMAYHTEISSVANTLNNFHIQSNMHTGYKHSLYNDKQDKFYEMFDQ